MSPLVEVKSLGGTNFVRADRVIAIQTTAQGTTVIVMEGGAVDFNGAGTVTHSAGSSPTARTRPITS